MSLGPPVTLPTRPAPGRMKAGSSSHPCQLLCGVTGFSGGVFTPELDGTSADQTAIDINDQLACDTLLLPSIMPRTGFAGLRLTVGLPGSPHSIPVQRDCGGRQWTAFARLPLRRGLCRLLTESSAANC